MYCSLTYQKVEHGKETNVSRMKLSGISESIVFASLMGTLISIRAHALSPGSSSLPPLRFPLFASPTNFEVFSYFLHVPNQTLDVAKECLPSFMASVRSLMESICRVLTQRVDIPPNDTVQLPSRPRENPESPNI